MRARTKPTPGMGFIYLAVCNINQKKYVGQTTSSLRKRRWEHEKSALNGSNGCPKFWPALRKRGVENFAWSILATVSVDDLDAQEAGFIAELDSVDNGYNVCRHGVTTRGVKLSDETRRKMSEAKRPPKSAEHRAALGEARRGRKLPPEWCKKIGDSKRGIKWSPEIIERRAAGNRGKKRSPEQIARRVAARRANAKNRPKAKWSVARRERIPRLEHDGQLRTLTEWAAIVGLSSGLIRRRLRMGWPAHEALTRPPSRTPAPPFTPPRRLTKQWEHEGRSRTLREWATIAGIEYSTLIARMSNGDSLSEAITRPLQRPGEPLRATKRWEFDGDSRTLREWASVSGVPYPALYRRLRRGWSLRDALTRPPDRRTVVHRRNRTK
jgi:group I intron endonuclease